jgi:DNA integrity scanning protein DisA with diadenylate cyclase activity
LQNVNIGSKEHPKIASIEDYWDEQTMNDISSLLLEYKDLFPKTFLETKGIKGTMGEMKIELKFDSTMNHRPYHLNPKVKEKVKREIKKFLRKQ